ncbi:ATP-binding protein [Paenibacillus nasutitermitis]|uniref:histidine kinase n=1 Tax=Paenibacillus nasutitermitis TaxID=1652958 RepID=A0A916ZGT0_9BACL|nr:ATP-binding protein [Paenibacillus nasutitermitis]GGD96803.1 hypothetical protein GCM10010911_64470 [Paenibacillus nasutitermitis]
MSVKTKLSFMMSFIVFILLLVNVILNEYYTRVNLRAETQFNMTYISEMIASSMAQHIREYELLQTVFDEKLKVASAEAAMLLGKDVNAVTGTQLEQLSDRLGLTHLSVIIPSDGEYRIRSSSDPKLGGLTIKSLGKPNQVPQEGLSDLKKSNDFWTSAIEFNTSDTTPGDSGKWGFYQMEDRGYILVSFIQNNQPRGLGEINLVSDLSQSMTNKLTVLEVSGFNPVLFGKGPVGEIPKMISVPEMMQHPVSFGSYEYQEIKMDEKNILAASQGDNVFRYTKIKGQDVIKSFVQVTSPVPYVIGLVLDAKPINRQIDEQRNNQLFISAILLIIVVFCSYWLSDFLIRPIRSILWKINEVSFGRFDNSIEVKRKDEIGQLAKRVNAMSKNLGIYMTKLKMAFEENRSMKEYLESFINHTTDAIHVVDLKGRVTQVNRAFEELLGYSADDAVGNILPLVPEHLHAEELHTMEGLKSGKHLTARETVRITKEGEWISVSVTSSPIRDKNGAIHAIASITRDMTSRNKMEELLRRSEKLTTVGQLAAGVAHEIRNPLTTLRGFLQLQLETNKLNTKHVDIMLSELDRINLIVGEFLILAKPQATRFEEKDVRFILGDVISLLDSQAHLCDIEFLTHFNIETGLISCEENQLKQVFINLLKNAIEAMPEGGQIQISLDYKGSGEVSISIVDQGIGIPEDMISKLGDPFFTGKDSGTGLGIMVSQRIIQSHQGTMEIRSKVNVGTSVTITLPLLQGRSDPPPRPLR